MRLITLIKHAFLVLIFILLTSSHSFANEALSQTTIGTGITTEELSYTGYSSDTDTSGRKSGGWDWNFGYSYTVINLGATVSASPTPGATTSTAAASDHTSSFSGGFGYSNLWSAGLELDYSSTKEENLSSFGPAIHLGYTFELAHDETKKKTEKKSQLKPKTLSATSTIIPSQSVEEESDDPFMPTLGIVLTVGNTRYNQDSSVGVRAGSRKLVNSKAGVLFINQRKAELSVTLSALEWVDLSISYQSYSYDRNVPAFITSLDDPRAIRSGAASFGSTLSGFSSNEAGAELTFHLPLDLDLALNYSKSTNASDGGVSKTYRTSLSRLWGDHWKTGLGFERDQSTTDFQNLGIATLAYEF